MLTSGEEKLTFETGTAGRLHQFAYSDAEYSKSVKKSHAVGNLTLGGRLDMKMEEVCASLQGGVESL